MKKENIVVYVLVYGLQQLQLLKVLTYNEQLYVAVFLSKTSSLMNLPSLSHFLTFIYILIKNNDKLNVHFEFHKHNISTPPTITLL